jgi:hypothetical protein
MLLSLVLLPWVLIIPGLIVALVIALVTRLGFERWQVWTGANWYNAPILLVLILIAWENGWPVNQPTEWLVVTIPLWCVMIWRSYRWAWRSLLGQSFEAGEGSASGLNKVLPAMINGRWARAGARLGWRLDTAAEGWKLDPTAAVPPLQRLAMKANGQDEQPMPMGPRPFGVAVDLSETRPFWLRPSPTLLSGSPEWPAVGLVKAAKRSGKWLTPVAARQTVYGRSGHGKSVLLNEYVVQQLRLGARVLFVDGKGANKDAIELFAKAEKAGLVGAHQQRWWRTDGGDAFSLLRGLDAFQQLDSLKTMRQAQVGDGKVNSHYEDNAVKGWAFALQALAAEKAGEAPSLGELRERLMGLDQELQEVIDKSGTTVGTVASDTLDHVTRSMLGNWEAESPAGWSPVPGTGVDGWRLAIVSAPAASDAGRAATAGTLYRLAVEAARATDAAKQREPLVIVIDEAASVFKSAQARSAIETLVAQGRSAGYSITLAFQDPGQLDAETGGDHFRRMVETNSELVWLGPIAGAARVLELGGNKFGNEATRPGLGSEGSTSVRAQSGYGVSPTVIERLPLWSWGVYSRGRWTGVMVPPS